MNAPNLPAPTRPVIVSPDTRRGDGDPAARTPPGQTLTAKWPVLHAGKVPKVDPHAEAWELRVFGAACDAPYELSYAELKALPTVDVRCDMHCVTHWSRLDNVFTGVPTKLLVDRARPRADARYVMCHAENGFTTNVPIRAFTADDCVLAWAWDGTDLTPDHGYPLRGVVPRLYLWKSAKWIRAIEIRTADAPGFWEQNGYHMRGDPWREERFGW